ncbi:MAG: hypothetical protein LQ338_003414 [Usnochroma carphineum]|nr:MAG: hypothetical protein LQ338_003414 [Usnochroma carphineum]
MPPDRSHHPSSQLQYYLSKYNAKSSYPNRLTLPSDDSPTRRGSRTPYTLSSAIMPPTKVDLCRDSSCPLKFPHSPGLYLHLNQPSRFTQIPPHFGASNPPPHIWEARDRFRDGKQSEADVEIIMGFIGAHHVPWTDREVEEQQERVRLGFAGKEELEEEERFGQGLKVKRGSEEMRALVEEMEEVEIKDCVDDRGQVVRSRAPSPADEMDREIERAFEEAWMEMEVEEKVGRMSINDFGEGKGEGDVGSRSGSGIGDLIEEAHRVCVGVGEEMGAEDGDEEGDDVIS